MRITGIKIENWRGLAEVSVTAAPPTVLLFGAIGAGKTSALDAVRYALLGHCSYTDERGAGYKKLIRDGADSASISVEIDARLFVECLITPSKSEWSCFDMTTGEKYANDRDDLLGKLGIKKDYARICLMPEDYLISDSDFGGLLAGFLGEVNVDQLRNMMSDDEWDWLCAFKKANHIGDFADITNLDHLGKVAYTKRREANAELKTARGELESYGTMPTGITHNGRRYTTADIPAVKAVLETLMETLRELERDRGAAGVGVSQEEYDAAMAEATEKHAATASRVKEAQAAVKAAQEAQGTAQANLTDAQTQEATAVQRREAEAKRLAAATNDRETARVLVADRKAIYENIQTWTTCDRCSGKLTKATREYLGKQALADLSTAEASLDVTARAVAEIEAVYNIAKAECEERLAAIEPLRKILSVAKDVVTAADKALFAANEANATALARVEGVRSTPIRKDVGDIEARLVAQEGKLTRGQTLVKELETLKKYEDAKNNVQCIEKRIDRLDWAEKAFNKGEISRVFLRTDAFLQRVNAELTPFGFKMEIVVDGKNVVVMLQPPDKPMLDVKYCSNGERFIATAALAMAFGDIVGTVLLDNLNELDCATRTRFLQRSREHGLETLVLAGAWQKRKDLSDDERAMLAPVATLWLADGTAK